MKLKVKGLADVSRSLEELGKTSKEALADTINDILMDTQSFAVKGLKSGPASGRTYFRGGVSHKASAPGQYPMSDTGRLQSSIQFNMATPASLRGDVGTNIKYGLYLEFGTSTMAARPWLLPSFKQSVATIGKELKAKFEGGV